ncbi:hypothetical protein L1987_57553 [Smallanthus sonchifolius]|uniref:Uncharacterized protein n=1 Tax=Smallanthus sonchifolius TaxID=185202 RepID=A0ACB9DD10_9ASTR|nr:hypothetical protein L1987_57553 [Smallanthus sonchifolius]
MHFSNHDIKLLESGRPFPKNTIFRAFDPKTRANFSSDNWVFFPSFPFTIDFSYPFPALTTEFFEKTGLIYVKTMPMIWQTLHTLEILIRHHAHDFSVSKLAYVYNLRSHGSSRFLFQIKSGQNHMILKTTQNDSNWKNHFFFVRRDSIPGGDKFPVKWIMKVPSFSELAPPTPNTARRVAFFYGLEPIERTFKLRVPLVKANSKTYPSGSEMSCIRKSNSKFALDDIDNMISIGKKHQEGSKPAIVPSSQTRGSQT